MSTPPVVRNLLIINGLFFLAYALLPQYNLDMLKAFALYWPGSEHFMPHQLVTYMFMHGGIAHLFTNMFALWMFGRTLEYDLGSKRFLTFYLVTGIGAGLIQMLVNYFQLSGLNPVEQMAVLTSPYAATVGASGAVFGILLGFGLMHPNARIMLLIPPIPMKAKYFVIGYGVLELLIGVSGRMDNIAHFAHLGGMLWAFLLLMFWRKRRKIIF